jgi:TfoX/Sxy family transcriptional regulator of competence genes
MKLPPSHPHTSDRFRELLPNQAGVTSRLVFGNPAGFVEGQMFFGAFGEQLFVRLSEEDRREALGLPGSRTFEPMAGHPMREYVVLPEAIVFDTRKMRRWIDRSLAWASTLPPKRPRRPAANRPPRRSTRPR